MAELKGVLQNKQDIRAGGCFAGMNRAGGRQSCKACCTNKLSSHPGVVQACKALQEGVAELEAVLLQLKRDRLLAELAREPAGCAALERPAQPPAGGVRSDAGAAAPCSVVVGQTYRCATSCSCRWPKSLLAVQRLGAQRRS